MRKAPALPAFHPTEIERAETSAVVASASIDHAVDDFDVAALEAITNIRNESS